MFMGEGVKGERRGGLAPGLGWVPGGCRVAARFWVGARFLISLVVWRVKFSFDGGRGAGQDGSAGWLGGIHRGGVGVLRECCGERQAGRQAGRRGVFFSRGRGLKSLPSLSGSGRMGLSWTDFLVKLLW